MVSVTVRTTREDFARWLTRRIFEEMGLRPSVREIARRAGLSQGAVSSAIKGNRLPAPRTLMGLAGVLRVESTEMMRRAGVSPLYEFVPGSPPPVYLSEELRGLCEEALTLALQNLLSGAADSLER